MGDKILITINLPSKEELGGDTNAHWLSNTLETLAVEIDSVKDDSFDWEPGLWRPVSEPHLLRGVHVPGTKKVGRIECVGADPNTKRAKRVKALIADCAQRQVAAHPAGQALLAAMPVELGELIDHIVGNSAMLVDMALEDDE